MATRKGRYRINVVTQTQPGNWSGGFAKAVCSGLEDRGYTVTQVEVFGLPKESVQDSLKSSPQADLWYVIRSDDWSIPMLLGMGEKVATHSHGGVETGQFCDVMMGARTPDQSQLYRDLEFVTINSVAHQQAIRKHYGDKAADKAKIIGFPMDFSRFDVATAPKTLIAVTGRFAHEKQLPLLAKALEPFSDRVVFATGESADSPEGGKSQKVKMAVYLQRLGYAVLMECRGSTYEDLLARSKVVVTAGGWDTLNLSVIEGIASGASPVAPRMAPYTEYLEDGMYDPFSISDIREKVRHALTAPHSWHKVKQYDMDCVLSKLMDCFEEKSNGN